MFKKGNYECLIYNTKIIKLNESFYMRINFDQSALKFSYIYTAFLKNLNFLFYLNLFNSHPMHSLITYKAKPIFFYSLFLKRP